LNHTKHDNNKLHVIYPFIRGHQSIFHGQWIREFTPRALREGGQGTWVLLNRNVVSHCYETI